MAFQNSFNGKDTAVQLPSGEGLLKSQERMSDMILGAEKLKYDVYKKNSEDFLRASNVDPVFLLTDSAQKAQSQLLTNFNNKWGKVYQQYSGNLPDQVKQQMASEKNYLLMDQQKMQSDMQQAMAAKDAVQKDVQGNLDHEDFQKRWDSYISTGQWDSSPLLPSAVDPDEFFGKTINKGNFGKTKVTIAKKNADGTITTVSKIASGTEEDGRNLVASHMHSSDRLARGWIQKFQALKTNNPAEYDKYMKTEGANPILKWAQDNYWDKVLTTEDDTSTKPITTGANSGNMSTWLGIKYTPTSAQTSPFPSLPSENYHPFPDMAKQIKIPIGNMQVLNDGDPKPTSEQAGKTIQGWVTGYDEDSQKVIFTIGKDFKDLDYAALKNGEGMQVAIPKNSVSKEIFDELEVVKGANPVKLKDLTKPTTATSNSILERAKQLNSKSSKNKPK